MGINIGLDIGAISLKLAALGQPEDRSLLVSFCKEKPCFRLTEWDTPLVLSDYRRIAGSPIQSTFDLLQEFYEVIPKRRSTGYASRARAAGPSPRSWASTSRTSSSHRADDRELLSEGADGLRNRGREL